MELLDKIIGYQEVILSQTGDIPEYYVIDNYSDVQELKSWVLNNCTHEHYRLLLRIVAKTETKETFTLFGSKIIIDIIKEK